MLLDKRLRELNKRNFAQCRNRFKYLSLSENFHTFVKKYNIMKILIENLEDLRKTGIYSITNTINGKKYIGSTAKNFKTRYTQHLSKLRSGKHRCKHLQSAYNKYGNDCFLFKIEEVIDDCTNIRGIEKSYIERYNSIANGYNENPDPNKSPMLNNIQQKKVSEGLKIWWKRQKETLSKEEYKKLCMHHRGTKAPWNKGIKMSSEQTRLMHKPRTHGVSEAMKRVHKNNSKLGRDRGPYYLVYDENGNWINTFYSLTDLIEYSKSENNNLPVKTRKNKTRFLDLNKVVNAATGNKPYKGLFFKRVPKDRKLPCANGLNSWKAEKPIMSQALSTLSEGAETTGEVQSS